MSGIARCFHQTKVYISKEIEVKKNEKQLQVMAAF